MWVDRNRNQGGVAKADIEIDDRPRRNGLRTPASEIDRTFVFRIDQDHVALRVLPKLERNDD